MIGRCLNQAQCEERFRDMAGMSWVISQSPSLPVFHNSVKTELVSFENLFWNEEKNLRNEVDFWKCVLFTTLQI